MDDSPLLAACILAIKSIFAKCYSMACRKDPSAVSVKEGGKWTITWLLVRTGMVHSILVDSPLDLPNPI